jgi:fermentation-respiration switch protein FrsA (DUF1100 family)
VTKRAIAVLAFVVALPLLARAASRPLVFRGAGTAATRSSELAVRACTARDGARVHTLALPAAGAGARTVAVFHNNRETAEQQADLARALSERGLGALLVEYRGYGASRGSGPPSEDALYLDAEAALDMLAADGIGADRVVLCGISLGTGVAAEMARRGRGSALVLVAPYTSLPDLVTDVVPILPGRILVADTFDTLAKAPDVRMPTLVVHGDADEVVPFWMGERVASAIAGAELVRIRDGRHGDLFARDGRRILDAITRLTH